MSVDEIADRLYALSPEEFTQARNQAERELRKAREKEQADRVKALRKPTATAAAVNRLVREHRPEVDAFLAAAAGLRDAQFAGKGDIAQAAAAQREAGNNPWDGHTLEWATSSPPSTHNFDEPLPPIRSNRPVWDRDHPRHVTRVHEL